MLVRYIRDWQNGRTVNGQQGTNCDWREIQAIDYLGNNLARTGTVTTSHSMNAPLSNAIDGNFSSNLWTNAASGEIKNICVDLGGIYHIEKIIIARAESPAICKETKLEVSVDNIHWETIFNSVVDGTYQENINGKEFILQNDGLTSESSIEEIMNMVDVAYDRLNSYKTKLRNNLATFNIETTDIDPFPILIDSMNMIQVGSRKPGWCEVLDFILECTPPGISSSTYSYDNYASAVGDKVYLMGSRIDSNKSGYNTNLCYNTNDNTWSSKANIPTGRYGATSIDVGSKIYVFGGYNSDYSNNNECYDTLSNTWTSKKVIPTKIKDMSGDSVGNLIYLFGGNVSGSPVNTTRCYDTVSNTWTDKANLPNRSLYDTSSCYVEGYGVYVIGGYIPNIGVKYNSCYNNETNTWTAKAELPYERNGSGIGLIDNYIYIIGGGSNVTIVRYSVEKNTWEEINSSISGRSTVTTAISNGNIYIFGDRNRAECLIL